MEKLKLLRRGKKTAITKRIEKLMGMAEAGGCSRRQMKLLMEKLATVYAELDGVCDEIADISILLGREEDSLNNLEIVRMQVDECTVYMVEHLESRQDEAPSSSSDSLTRSWVANSDFMAGACAKDMEDKDTSEKGRVSPVVKHGDGTAMEGTDFSSLNSGYTYNTRPRITSFQENKFLDPVQENTLLLDAAQENKLLLDSVQQNRLVPFPETGDLLDLFPGVASASREADATTTEEIVAVSPEISTTMLELSQLYEEELEIMDGANASGKDGKKTSGSDGGIQSKGSMVTYFSENIQGVTARIPGFASMGEVSDVAKKIDPDVRRRTYGASFVDDPENSFKIIRNKTSDVDIPSDSKHDSSSILGRRSGFGKEFNVLGGVAASKEFNVLGVAASKEFNVLGGGVAASKEFNDLGGVASDEPCVLGVGALLQRQREEQLLVQQLQHQSE